MLNAFPQISHTNLINILKDLPGPKDLVVEHLLFKPLEMIIDMKSLRYKRCQNFEFLKKIHYVLLVVTDSMGLTRFINYKNLSTQLLIGSASFWFHLI